MSNSEENSLSFTERFLLVSGDFVQTGGMDMGNYHLADFLARSGVEVHLAAHRVDPSLLAYPDVFFHRALRPGGSHFLAQPLLKWVGRSVARRLSAGQPGGFRVLVNGGNCPLPDLNWVHYVHAVAPSFGGGGAMRRIKARITRRQFQHQEERALRRARIIIANSHRTKADLLDHYNLDETRIHVVYYGTDPKTYYVPSNEQKIASRCKLGLPPQKHLIAFVGAMGDRRKGFDTLFSAWSMLGSELSSRVELVVIGTGAELPLWRQRAAEQFDRHPIRFLGFRRDVPAILRACDGFVAPTRYEAFGLAAQEALCCGLPVVVSRRAGVAERFPASLGELLLDDPESVDELVDKLQKLIRHKSRLTESAAAAATELRSYTWDDMSKTIYALACR